MPNIMHLTNGDDPAAFSIIITKSELIRDNYIITGKSNDSIFTFEQTGRDNVTPNDDYTRGYFGINPIAFTTTKEITFTQVHSPSPVTNYPTALFPALFHPGHGRRKSKRRKSKKRKSKKRKSKRKSC